MWYFPHRTSEHAAAQLHCPNNLSNKNTWTRPYFGPSTAIKHACPHLPPCFRSTVQKDSCTLFSYFLSAVQAYSTTGCVRRMKSERKDSVHIDFRGLLLSLKCFYVYTIFYGCSQSTLGCLLHWKWHKGLILRSKDTFRAPGSCSASIGIRNILPLKKTYFSKVNFDSKWRVPASTQ